MRFTTRNIRVFQATAALLAVLGCGESTTGPFANLSATNNADDFVFIAQTFGHPATTAIHYTWQNNGSVALFTLGNTALGGGMLPPIQGTGTVTVKDAAGAQVYSHSLVGDASDTTAAGMPGNWSIDLAFNAANGDIVFELKRAPRDITVSATTTGTNQDIDGYTLTMDGTNSQPISANGVATYSAVSAGNHTIVLSGIAANCTLTGSASQTVNVPAGVPTGIAYSVTCT